MKTNLRSRDLFFRVHAQLNTLQPPDLFLCPLDLWPDTMFAMHHCTKLDINEIKLLPNQTATTVKCRVCTDTLVTIKYCHIW